MASCVKNMNVKNVKVPQYNFYLFAETTLCAYLPRGKRHSNKATANKSGVYSSKRAI